MATSLQAVITMIAGVTIAFAFGWKLALVILGTVPILAAAGVIQMKAVMGNQKRDSKLLEEAGNVSENIHINEDFFVSLVVCWLADFLQTSFVKVFFRYF